MITKLTGTIFYWTVLAKPSKEILAR